MQISPHIFDLAHLLSTRLLHRSLCAAIFPHTTSTSACLPWLLSPYFFYGDSFRCFGWSNTDENQNSGRLRNNPVERASPSWYAGAEGGSTERTGGAHKHFTLPAMILSDPPGPLRGFLLLYIFYPNGGLNSFYSLRDTKTTSQFKAEKGTIFVTLRLITSI